MKYSRKRSAGQLAHNHAVMHSAVLPMSISDLVERSEAVVQGSVLGTAGVDTVYSPGFDLLIPFTDVRVTVHQYLTGALTFGEIKVRTLGGTTTSASFEAPEEPTFSPGEEVVLFICKDTGNLFDLPEDTFTVQGLFQGKYSVIRRGGPDLAVGIEGRTVVPLDTLIDQVRHAGGGSPATSGSS
jgi:hypothetical protein